MSNLARSLINHRFDRIKLISIIVFLMPVFFLTVKSWVTTSLFLLFFVCCWPIISNLTHYFSNRSKHFWMFLGCLLVPFFSEVFAQIGRGEIIGSSLDGPSRMLLTAVVFIYLSRADVSDVVKALSCGAMIGVLGVAFSLLVFPEQYWQHRAATYFVDPITLPCFTIALLGLSLFLGDRVFPTRFSVIFKAILTIVAAYVAVESYSRSAWVAFICLLTVYVIYSFRHSFKTQVIGVVGLLIGLILFYFLSDIVYSRINESVRGVLAFLLQDEDLRHTVQHTSSGQRILLGLIDVHLILGSPFFGVSDRESLPPYEQLLGGMPILTKEIYEIKILAGSHTEILAQLVRQGIIFGSFTLCSLFFYPLYVIVWRFRRITFGDGSLLVGALGIIIPILASSLTIQVFNLKMTISFYGLCLAIFFAGLCWNIEKESTKNLI